MTAGGRERPEPGYVARRERELRGSARTELTLLRHGEPDWAPQGRAVDDPELTPFGRRQAEAAARALTVRRIDAIYVSPYRRARQTAEPLACATGLEPVVVAELAEIGVAVAGASQAEVDRYFVEAVRRPLGDHWEGWPGAESFRTFHARVVRGLEQLLARHGIRSRREADFTLWSGAERRPSQSLVVVAHGGTNAVLLTHLLDIQPVPWEWLRFESELCAYSVARARRLGGHGDVWSLVNFNEVDHLRDAGLR